MTSVGARPFMGRPSRRARPGWRSLAAVLVGTGTLHFVSPGTFDRIVPDVLGHPRPWVYASGVAELLCAGGLVMPATRRVAGWGCVGLFVAVFPANVQMAVDAFTSPRTGSLYRAATVARLPMQVPLVMWAWSVAVRAKRPASPDPGVPGPDVHGGSSQGLS